MQRIIWLSILFAALTLFRAGADTITLTDGATFEGEIIKSDDNGVMFHRSDDIYTNLLWSRFSQDSLKQLAGNPKLAEFVEPFIEPPATQRPAPVAIQVNPVSRLERPANPSVIGGFFTSSVGLFVVGLLYLANLYAAFEVALIRNRPLFQVIGLAAIAPVIVPAVFAWLPVVIEAPVEAAPMEGALPEKINMATPAGQEIQAEPAVGSGPKKPEVQVFSRGKFTFNKRFIETKFAGFVGVPKGDATKYTLQLRTSQQQLTVERIAQVGASEALLETRESGQVTVPFADIQEIQLIPIPA